MISVAQKKSLKKNSWISRAWDQRDLVLVAVSVLPITWWTWQMSY